MPLSLNQIAIAISRLPRKSQPRWVIAPAITNATLEAGDVVRFSPGVVIGFPAPSTTTAILVDGVDKGPGPYTVQPADSGKQIRVERVATNERGQRTSVSQPVIVAGSPMPDDTWLGRRTLAANMPVLSDWDKSHPFVDLMATARPWRKYADPWSETSDALASLKANGQPAEDASIILLDNGVAGEEGVYLCRFSGTGTPETYIGGKVSNVQTTGGVTTFQISRGAFPADGSDPRIVLRISGIGPSFGDAVPFECLRVGAARGTGQVWGDAWLAHLQGMGRLRFMNWLRTNDSRETSVDHALAFSSKPQEYGARIATHLDLCNRLSMGGWWNTPAMADAALRSAYASAIHSALDPRLTAWLEHSNEPWNTYFLAYGQGLDATIALTSALHGAQIVSLVRSGRVVTAELAQPHGKTVGDQVSIAGARSDAKGPWASEVVTLTSGSVGSTLRWNSSQSGGDTAELNEGTTIYLNPTHMLCAPTATLPVPDIYSAKENWDIAQVRANFTAIANVSGASARLKPALGTQLDVVSRLGRMMQWCRDTYGSAEWMVWTTAYYAQPAEGTQPSLDTEQEVCESLEASRLVQRTNLWRLRNLALSFNAPIAIYEMGPHNDVKTGATQAAVAAVHASDWMRLFVKQMLQDVRDLCGCEAAYFQLGAVDTYGTTTNNTWCAVSPIIGQYVNSAKWRALDETKSVSFVPEPVDGLTWGTLSWVTAHPWLFSEAAGNLIVAHDRAVPELCQAITAPSDGSFPLTIKAGCNWGGDRITILIDDVVVAANVLLPNQNPYVEAAAMAWSGSVTLTKGSHKLAIRVAAAPRGAQIGLGPTEFGVVEPAQGS